MLHRIITGTTTEEDARSLVLILWLVFIVGFMVGALIVLNIK